MAPDRSLFVSGHSYQLFQHSVFTQQYLCWRYIQFVANVFIWWDISKNSVDIFNVLEGTKILKKLISLKLVQLQVVSAVNFYSN
jgi:hypothetical protein